MKQPLVSILVPIYNVEKYLRQCLDSLVNQTLQDLEIICINDGSKDESLAIIQEYAAKDKRIKIISKQNTGYGDSMNQGLKKAKGKYIGIVEPDDFVELDTFADLTKLANKFQADIVKANYYYHSKNGDELQTIINPTEVNQLIDPSKNQHIFHQPPTIWAAIYRRKFLIEQGIDFLPTPGASYQDTGFNFKALASTHCVAYTDKAYLHYRIDNENSSVKSASKIFAVSEEFASIKQFLLNKKLYKKFGSVMQAYKFGSYHWNLLRLPNDAVKEFLPTMRSEFLQAKQDGILHKSYFPKKHWLALQLLLKSPKLFLTSFHTLEIIKKYQEIISYLIVGVLTTIISLGVKYLLLFTVLDASDAVQLQISVIISWICAVAFAYITNRKFVFKSKDKRIFQEMLRFVSARVATLVIEAVILWFFITLLGMNSNFYVVVWTTVSQILITIGNYLFSKLLVFRRPQK